MSTRPRPSSPSSEFPCPGGVASTSEEAAGIAAEMGEKSVVKAQVHAGGRGLAGGVKVVGSPEEAASVADDLLGNRLVTHQTGPDGVPVTRVLIEETAQIAKEFYLAVVIDSGSRGPVIMASEAGGMDIEEVAATTPEKILRVNVDVVIGLQPFQCRYLAYGSGPAGRADSPRLGTHRQPVPRLRGQGLLSRRDQPARPHRGGAATWPLTPS